MAARFILSLDCEGKWGVADHLTRREHEWLSDERLRQAYRSIIELLDDYDVPATFAFVGLFAEPKDSFRQLMPSIEALAASAPEYLRPALFDSSEGSRQGWHGEWALQAVCEARTQHEVALHGITHVPWTSRPASFFAQELALLEELSSPVSRSRTFVFPRNEVAHLDLLQSSGIQGYRACRPHRNRAHSLLSEFNLWADPEQDPSSLRQGMVPIPAGYFINWRHGPRRLVPRSVTAARFRGLLEKAESGGVVHAWTHPENFASAPETLDLLRDLLALVAKKRDSGRCIPTTQIDYVAGLQGNLE